MCTHLKGDRYAASPYDGAVELAVFGLSPGVGGCPVCELRLREAVRINPGR